MGHALLPFAFGLAISKHLETLVSDLDCEVPATATDGLKSPLMGMLEKPVPNTPEISSGFGFP